MLWHQACKLNFFGFALALEFSLACNPFSIGSVG